MCHQDLSMRWRHNLENLSMLGESMHDEIQKKEGATLYIQIVNANDTIRIFCLFVCLFISTVEHPTISGMHPSRTAVRFEVGRSVKVNQRRSTFDVNFTVLCQCNTEILCSLTSPMQQQWKPVRKVQQHVEILQDKAKQYKFDEKLIKIQPVKKNVKTNSQRQLLSTMYR